MVFGQKLDHSYLYQNKLVVKIEFVDEDKTTFREYIKVVKLKDKAIPFITPYLVVTNQQFPSIWHLDKDRILAISPHGAKDYKKFTLQQIKLLSKDSLTNVKEDTVMRQQYRIQYPEDWEFQFNSDLANRYQPNNLFRITPLNDWWNVQFQSTFFERIIFLEKYVETFKRNRITDVDFCYQSGVDKYHFYQRTENNFFIWSYGGGAKKDTIFSDWHLERHYSIDSIFLVPSLKELELFRNRFGQPLLPDTTHFLPCTITDTAFFCGHNKAIQQGNQHWLINTSHGAIYYLADYGVVKVAQIENFQNYPAAILQRRLFIEDRDKGELIVFSRLTRTDREAPLPKYRSLITPRAISQRFGALATVPKTNRK
jgi:hypothetical protein